MRLPNLLDILHLPQPRHRPRSMGWGAHLRATIHLAIPLVVGQVAMIAIWTADIIMLGYIGADALAAGVQGQRLFQPLYFFAIGLLVAVSPLTAQALGAHTRRQARRIMRQGMWLAVVYGAATMIPMWHGGGVLRLFGQGEEIANNAAPFLQMLSLGMIPTFIFFVLRNYISAHRKPFPPVIAALLGTVLNIALNAMLSLGLFGMPEMGLAGIGLATTITFALMAAGLMLYMHTQSPFAFTKPFVRLWVLDFGIMRRLLIIGTPISLTLLAETGMFIFLGLYTGIFGTHAVAASGIANQIAAIVFMAPLAISHAASIRIGHEAGANRRRDILRAGYAAVIITLAVLGCNIILLAGFAETWFGLFLRQSDPAYEAVWQIAAPMIAIVAMFQIFDGTQVLFSSLLRGLNDTRIPALISVLAFWGIGVTTAITLADGRGFGLGPVAVWWGILCGLFAGTLLLGYRCLATHNRIMRGGRILMA